MEQTPLTTPSSPGLWRLAAAARMAGMSPDSLAALCERGEVPVTLERLGPRGLRYVRCAELNAWLQGRSTKTGVAADEFARLFGTNS